MQPKHVAFVGVTCVTIGWLLASTLTPPIARVQTRPQPAPRDASIPDASALAEELQLKLRHVPTPPTGRRNPFVFGTAESIEPPLTEPHINPAEVLSDPTPPSPPYVLAGIGISGDTRTAVLAAGDDVHIVKVDDVVGVYTVVEITNSSVTLRRDLDQYTLRFAH
jgi:hypothetical protein